MKRLSFIYCFLLVSSLLYSSFGKSFELAKTVCDANEYGEIFNSGKVRADLEYQDVKEKAESCYKKLLNKLQEIRKQIDYSEEYGGWGKFLRIAETLEYIKNKENHIEDLINNSNIESILNEKEKHAKSFRNFIDSFNVCDEKLSSPNISQNLFVLIPTSLDKIQNLTNSYNSQECKDFDTNYQSMYQTLNTLADQILTDKRKTLDSCKEYINNKFFSTITTAENNGDNSGGNSGEEKGSEVNPSENSLIGSCSNAKDISEECRKPLSYADLVSHLGKGETASCNRSNLSNLDIEVGKMCEAKKRGCETKCKNKLDEFKTAFAMCFFYKDFKYVEMNVIMPLALRNTMREIKETYIQAINDERARIAGETGEVVKPMGKESNPSLEVSELVTCKVVEDEEILGVSNDIARSEKIGMCKGKSDPELNLLRRGIRPEQINQAGSQSGSGIPTGGTNGNEYSDDSDFWTGGSLGDQSLTSSSSDGSNVFFKPGEPTPLGGTLFTHDPNSVTSAGDEVAESGEEGRLEGESSEEDVATNAEELDSQVGDAPGLHEDGDVSVAGVDLDSGEENKEAQSGTEESARKIAGRRSSRRVEKVGKGGRVSGWPVSRGGGSRRYSNKQNSRLGGLAFRGLASSGGNVFNAAQHSGGVNNPSGESILYSYSKELQQGICAVNDDAFVCNREI